MKHDNKKKKLPVPGHGRRRVAGLSLIELMVALAIGSFLISGAVWVYIQSRQNYTLNESLARLQENARYAMGTLEPDLRQANYWGLTNNPGMITGVRDDQPLDVPAGAETCGEDFAIDLRRPLEGVNQDGYAGNPVPCTASTSNAGTRRNTADTLVVRRASETTELPAADTLQIYTTRQGGSSTLFVDGNLPGPIVDDPLFGPTAEVRALVVRAYYVANGSSLPGQPSLRRRNLVGDSGGGGPRFMDEEILPGVEDLQVQFGIDPGFDGDGDNLPDDRDNNGFPDRYEGIATRYVNPGDTALATAQIVAVRVWIRLRAETPEQGFVDNKTYDYADVTYTPQGADASFRRMLVSRTIQIRNTVNFQI